MFLSKQSVDRRRILFSFGLPSIFLLVYVLFDILYSALPDAALNRWLYEPFVSFCVGLIHWITPDHNVWAVQNKILSAEGNLEMVRTCDGSYSFILLAAAMAVFKAPIRAKLFGMAGALLLVVCLNLLRIVTLFFGNYSRPIAAFPARAI